MGTAFKALVTLLAVALGVATPAIGDTLPAGYQVGTLNVPISCNVPLAGTVTSTVSFTGATPTDLGPGQQYYVAGWGTMSFPQTLTNVLATLGVKSFTATIDTADLDATDTTPSSNNFAATPLVVGPISVLNGKPTTMAFPSSGQMRVGPLTAGPAGNVVLSLGAISLTMKVSWSSTVSLSMPVKCSPPSPAVILVGMQDGGAAGQAALPLGTVAPISEPFIPVGGQYGVIDVPWACTAAGSPPLPADVTIGGYGPTFLTPGQVMNISDVAGAIAFEPASVDTWIARGAAAARVTMNDFEMDASGATPASLNASGTITGPALPLTPGQPVSMAISATGAGPFTVGSGSTAIFTYGTSTASVALLDAHGNQLGQPLKLSCAPPQPAPIVFQLAIDAATKPPAIATMTTRGTQVTITGQNLGSVSEVMFGSQPASSFSIGLLGSSITATAPAQPGATTVDVTLIGPGGTSSLSSADRY